MILRLKSFWLLAAIAFFFYIGQPAFADNVTFTQGNISLLNEENVLFHNDVSGMFIMGFTNQSNTEIDFSSTTDMLMGQGGQSRVSAQDGLINDITITSPTLNFQGVVFNAFQPVNDNDLFVTVIDVNNNSYTYQYGNTNGQNFLTIVDTDGHNIKSITIDSPGGFDELRQVRVGDGVDTTPEPSSLVLFGTGLLGGIGYLRRKK